MPLCRSPLSLWCSAHSPLSDIVMPGAIATMQQRRRNHRVSSSQAARWASSLSSPLPFSEANLASGPQDVSRSRGRQRRETRMPQRQPQVLPSGPGCSRYFGMKSGFRTARHGRTRTRRTSARPWVPVLAWRWYSTRRQRDWVRHLPLPAWI